MGSTIALNTELNFDQIFKLSAGLRIILSPSLHFLAVNNGYLKAVHRTREELIGKYVFDVFPNNPNTPSYQAASKAKASFDWVIKHKERLVKPITRYDIKRPEHLGGNFEERYWEPTYTPILDDTGTLLYILHESRDCTNQVLAEREMEKSFSNFRSISEGVGGVVWECDILKDELNWSTAYKDIFGYSDDDLCTSLDTWEKNVHPEDKLRILPTLEVAKETKSKTWTGEYRYRKADGTYADVLDHGYMFYDDQGRLIRMLGSMIDLGKQKQHEQELKESNERFARIAMVTNDVIWDWNLREDSVWWNEGLSKLFGYPNITITRSSFWKDHIHPEDIERVEHSIHEVIDSGETYWESEYRFRCYDNSYKIVYDKGYVIHDEAGKPIRMTGAMLDITEKKKIEQERESQLNWLKKVIDSLPHMTWITSPNGTVEFFNQRWLTYTGMTQEESLGQDLWLSAVHPDDKERTIQRWHFSVHSGEYYEVEYRIRSGSSGTYRWFMGQGIPLRDENGNIIKWIGSCIDIEDHKRAEESLVEKNLELEQINQDLDSFVYTASHDLKLPIINMAGIFEELTKDANFHDPEAPKMIAMFRKSLEQLQTTIYDLSEVVKVQKTKKRDLEEVSFEEVVEDVKLSLQSSISDTGTQIIYDFSQASAVPFTKANLKSVLFNLISNSIKYRSPDRAPVVTISTRVKGGYIELSLKDNGLGIDMNKHQNKLFQMFKRFHNHVNGSGLGLYIVNRLLTNYGGYINIESNTGEGTTFLLYFKRN